MTAVQDIFKDMHERREEEKKKRPIRYFFYYHVYLHLYRIWNNNITMWHKEIYWFFQRGFRGYSDRDTWSFAHYLSKVIRDGLLKLKKDKIGYPCSVLDKNYLDRDLTAEEEADAIASWNTILDTIIYSFDMIVKEEEGSVIYWYEGCEKSRERLKTSYAEIYKDTKFLTEEEQKKIEIGKQLFIKHFHDFWD
jgi:hypothetical protein